jgi:NADH-quinone oxidoreductase subunit N
MRGQSAAPLLVLAVAVAVLLAAIAIRRSYSVAVAIAVTGLGGALAVIPWAMHGAPDAISALLSFTPQSLGLCGLIIVSALAILILAIPYFQPVIRCEEYPLLLLLGTLGAVAMAASASFITLFLGVETLSLAMIGMIAYPKFRPEAEEAGIKYLVLSGMSSAVGLFGIGLIELATGSLALQPVAAPGAHVILLAGLAMLGIAAGFKLSVVPFHIWVPDVYAGSPVPSTAYLAVIPKIAVFAVLMRLLSPGSSLPTGIIAAMTIAAGLSMLIGNLLALLQENIKRILGYSSIAHLGNILFAILAAGEIGKLAAMFYIVTYSLTVIAAFGVLGALSRATEPRDLDQLDGMRGLFWSQPVLAGIMTLAMLSLAGVPPAIGFIAKMYLMAAGINANLMLLVWTMVVSSVLGLFYYLRVVIVMASRPEAVTSQGSVLAIPRVGQLALALFGVLIAGFGVDPQLLTSLLKSVFG